MRIPDDLPTQPSGESDAELLGLAQAGDWAEFFALCPESGNPDGAEGLRSCLLLGPGCARILGCLPGSQTDPTG